METVIPIELNELSWRTGTNTNFQANAKTLREELELIDEIRSEVALKEIELKQKIAARHNRRVIQREFQFGDQANNSTVHTKFKLTSCTLSQTSIYNGGRDLCYSDSKI